LTSARFKELLDVFRTSYDFVLVDTSPVLAVTDPGVVAAQVDAVLLTIRLSKNSRPHAEQATEILSTLGANVLGVVVNGINRTGSRGGYHDSSYQYGSSYADDEEANGWRAPAKRIRTGEPIGGTGASGAESATGAGRAEQSRWQRIFHRGKWGHRAKGLWLCWLRLWW
jgi:hypothetical protein